MRTLSLRPCGPLLLLWLGRWRGHQSSPLVHECKLDVATRRTQHEPGLEWHEAMQAEALFPVVDENFYRNYTASAAWGD